MHADAPDSRSSDVFFEQTVTSTGRLIGVIAGSVIALAGSAVHEALIVPLGLIVLIGALTARASSTSIERGAIVLRMAPAPLRPGSTRIIPPDRVRGIEVLHAYDSDAAPGRHDEYWVAVRLVDRRRPVSLGRHHYDRATAEHEAAQLRAALGGARAPGPELPLHLAATAKERLLLAAGAAISGLVSWQAMVGAGGRPIEDVWPLAAIALAAALVSLGLAAAALLTQGTHGAVRPATAHVELRRGVGWLGARSSIVPFEDITAIAVVDEQTSGTGTVVMTRSDGTQVAIHAGPDARHTAVAVQRAVATPANPFKPRQGR